MAISRANFGSTDVSENYEVSIDMLTSQPDTQAVLNPVVTPNLLVGYYNATYDVVELYISNNTGTRWFRMT